MRSMKNVTVFTEDGAFALFFRPHPKGFDSSRVPTPGNLPSKAKKMLMPRGQSGGALGTAGIDWCITGEVYKLIITQKTYIKQRNLVLASLVIIKHWPGLISVMMSLFLAKETTGISQSWYCRSYDRDNDNESEYAKKPKDTLDCSKLYNIREWELHVSPPDHPQITFQRSMTHKACVPCSPKTTDFSRFPEKRHSTKSSVVGFVTKLNAKHNRKNR